MIIHKLKVYPSKAKLSKKKQLAWKLAELASDNAKLNKDSVEMVINRITVSYTHLPLPTRDLV